MYKQLRKTSGGQVLIAVSDERFCRYLKDKRLQQAAFITFDVVDSDFQNNSLGDQAICSDTLIVKDKHAGETLALKGYARLSVASILGMSDQRIPAACMISAFLWAMLSWLYLRKKQEGSEAVTGLEDWFIRKWTSGFIRRHTLLSALLQCNSSSCCYSGMLRHIH